MQKFINIAEQHVQWLALGIGVFYLGLVGWQYVYQPNLNVPIAGKPVEPGHIETVIAEGPIKELFDKINSGNSVTINPPDVGKDWINVAEDNSAVVTNYPAVYQTNPLGGAGTDQGPQIQNPGIPKLAGLPKPPSTIPVAVASYRTLIEFVDPKFDAANAQAGAVVPIISKDIDAVSYECKVDAKALAKAFQDAFPPNANPKVFQTMYLRVHLWRQEQNGPDKWSAPVEIPALMINPLQPLPQGEVDEQTGTIYRLFAGANQDQILHPPFYQTAKNAPAWFPPDQAPAAPGKAGAAPVAAVVAPAPPPAPAFNPAFAGADTLQPGMFNPVQKVADDIIIAHDDTVVADKTYRYYVQYSIYNPLFHSPKLGADAAVKQFDLSSPGMDAAQAADISQPITIPSRTQIFVKSVQGTTVHFAVFQWTPNIKMTEISATPGDTLAPSPYMLVDVRQDMSTPSHTQYVLLVKPDEKDVRRDVLKDKTDPEFLKDQQDAAAAITPVVGPVTPGTGTPGGTDRPVPPGKPSLSND